MQGYTGYVVFWITYITLTGSMISPNKRPFISSYLLRLIYKFVIQLTDATALTSL